MAKKFRDLMAKLPAERRARIEARAQQMLAELPLHELRQARKLTQKALAAAMGTGQTSVSKLERRADMYVGTLRNLIQAMGGELEIVARFPEGEYKITQFGELKRRRNAPKVKSGTVTAGTNR